MSQIEHSEAVGMPLGESYQRLAAEENSRWVSHLRIVAALNTGVGLFALSLSVVFMKGETSEWTHLAVVMTLFGLAHLTGFALAFGQRWARWILWPLSVLDLLGFPTLTALGLYNLWVLLHTRAERPDR